MEDRESQRGWRRSLSSFLAIVVLPSVAACAESVEDPVVPSSSDETCILCGGDGEGEGETLNPYLEQFQDDAYDDHNDGLADVLVELETTAGSGSLTASQAEDVGEPAIRDFLEDRGYTVPSGYWSDVTDAQNRHSGGQDIVAYYDDGSLSTTAQDYARDLLAIVDGSTPRSHAAVEADLDALLLEAQDQLSGDELEGFAAVVGIAKGSNTYWRASAQNLNDWDATLSASMSDVSECGWRMLGGDVIGGVFGYLFGGPVGGVRGAATGSTAAAVLSGSVCNPLT